MQRLVVVHRAQPQVDDAHHQRHEDDREYDRFHRVGAPQPGQAHAGPEGAHRGTSTMLAPGVSKTVRQPSKRSVTSPPNCRCSSLPR